MIPSYVFLRWRNIATRRHAVNNYMKKLLIVVLALIALLVAAVLASPFFINAGKYKTEVENQFKAATGYDLSLKGKVEVGLFPSIHAVAKDVSIYNGTRNIVNIEQVTFYAKTGSIFSDKLEIYKLKVDKPIITLEVTENDDNWTPIRDPKAVIPITKLNTKIETVEVVDGKLDYTDKVEDKAYNFTNINFNNRIKSLNGPVDFDGSAKYGDLNLSAKGILHNFTEPRITITANLLSSEVSYDGTLDEGKFLIKSDNIEPLATFLGMENWGKQLANQKVDLSGEIAYENEEMIEFTGLKMAVGNSYGEGDLYAKYDERMEVESTLKFKKLDLDQLLPADDKKKKNEEEKKEQLEEINRFQNMNAELDITADEIIYGGAVYKNLIIKSTRENNTVTLQPFSIDFPKSGRAEMFGVLSDDSEGRVFEGHITAKSNNLSDIIKSLKLIPLEVNPGTMESFDLNSEIVVNLRDHPSADLSDATLIVDNSLFKGNISLDFTETTGVSLNGTIDVVNLDTYIIPDEPLTEAQKKQQTGPTDDKPYKITWLEKLPMKGSINLLISKLIYQDENYNNFRARASYKPEMLDVEEVSFSGRKIQATAKGQIYAYPGKKPKIDVQANLGRINTADFIDSKTDYPRPKDKTRWSKEPFNLSFLRKIEIDFGGNVLSFIHGKYSFDNMFVKGYIENGKIVMEKAAGNMFGGKVELLGTVEATAVPSVGFSFVGSNVDANKLLDALADNTRVTGKVNFSGSASTSGVYQQAMMGNLKGSIALLSNSLVVRGFDIDGMAQQLINTNNVADVVSIGRTVSGEDAVTYLKLLNGTIVFENGIGRPQNKGIQLTATAGEGIYSGKGDLVNWTMDTNAVFKINTTERKAKPDLGIRIYGPIDDPNKDINLDAIKRYISGRGAKLLLNQ